MLFVLPIDKKVKVTLTPKDRAGNPATIDGKPVWSVSDAALYAVTPSDDGMSAYFVPVGPLGNVQGSVTADVDTGEAVDLGPSVGPLED